MKKKRDRILRRCVCVYSSHSTRRRPCQWRPTDSGCSSSNERHGKIRIHFFVNLINQSINEIVKLAVSDRRPRSVWNTVGSVVSSRVNINLTKCEQVLLVSASVDPLANRQTSSPPFYYIFYLLLPPTSTILLLLLIF